MRWGYAEILARLGKNKGLQGTGGVRIEPHNDVGGDGKKRVQKNTPQEVQHDDRPYDSRVVTTLGRKRGQTSGKGEGEGKDLS